MLHFLQQLPTTERPIKSNTYNLDAILSVGYRVNSKRGTQFRIWATRILRDHILTRVHR